MPTKPNVRAGRHFRMLEFDCKDGTAVPRHAYDDVRELCRRLLDPARDQFGPCTVLSGYRTKAHNRAVGGAPQSYHVYDLGSARGVGADVTFRRGNPHEWALFFEWKQAGGLGLYGSHVHVDTRADQTRWSG